VYTSDSNEKVISNFCGNQKVQLPKTQSSKPLKIPQYP